MNALELQEELLKSQWPKCNSLAEEAYQMGKEGKAILFAALKAKRHHIRTAAIRNLAKYGDSSMIPIFEEMLDDLAYETRKEAATAIEFLSE